MKRYIKSLYRSFTALVIMAGFNALAITPDTQIPISSIWKHIATGTALTAQEKREIFVQDCKAAGDLNKTIPEHTKNTGTLRIATYNVHDWLDATFKPNYDGIMQVINNMQADVLVLQEARLFDAKKVFADLLALGYVHTTFCPIKDGSKGQTGNLIASKYPFTKKPHKHFYTVDAQRKAQPGKKKPETMNFIHVELALGGDKTISVYGTYCMYGIRPEERRIQELKELIEAVNNDPNPNKIILADFNAVRARDYAYSVGGKSVWEMLQENDKKRTGMATPTDATQLLERIGWKDSFAKANIQGPKYTVWPGKVVDYMWMTKEWQLPVVGSYAYYDAASDHLPIITDIQIRLITPTMAFLNNPKLLKRVRELWGKEIDTYRDSVIKPILHNEFRYNDTHYCFYHAQQTIFQLIHDLCKELYTRLGKGTVPNDFAFLRFWHNSVEQMTANEFIDAHENGNHHTRWFNRHMAEKILSVNLALFGNLEHGGECSFYYFLKNYSVNNNFSSQGLHDARAIARHLVEDILKKLGLNTTYAQPVSELVDLLDAPTGNLFQILVPKEKVDDWMYVCHGANTYGYGTPYRVNDLSYDKAVQAAYSPEKNRFIKISPLLDAYRKKPESIPNIDKIQARLVFVPEVLDPKSGIKIIRFSTMEQKILATYQMKLKELVAQILADRAR